MIGSLLGEFSAGDASDYDMCRVFGLQIASTTLYAYVSDCYRPQTPETGVLFNPSRGLSFLVGYFALPFADKAGFAWAWFTFAVVLLVFFVPVGALLLVGRRVEGKGGAAWVSWVAIEYLGLHAVSFAELWDLIGFGERC
ncbi:hypothetical protein DSL72_004652 [Monilinia vaccinii-corymbosi]|uniref:Uncharacterized protein n=1 Tax=Monilinia vaccinii-corymbosi TaxID=61207 RepID=A0A8A3NZS9_9HELO|nr:hypothetical protein DSL72_004652 [Monilinia vaccinii-corymbosi]